MPKTRGTDRDLLYLLQLTRKYDLTPRTLHAAISTAHQRKHGHCGKLQIEIRSRREDSSTYMFSADGKSFAQAVIPDISLEKLRRLPDEFSSYPGAGGFRNATKKAAEPRESAIRDLKLGTSGVSFRAHVVKKSDVRAVTSKDGNPLLVCSVILSDGTGEIPLAVWNSQIATVSEGDLVEVRDARVRNFRGEIQLSLNRKTGALTVLQPAMRPQATVMTN
jgi:hypothetical protein